MAIKIIKKHESIPRESTGFSRRILEENVPDYYSGTVFVRRQFQSEWPTFRIFDHSGPARYIRIFDVISEVNCVLLHGSYYGLIEKPTLV